MILKAWSPAPIFLKSQAFWLCSLWPSVLVVPLWASPLRPRLPAVLFWTFLLTPDPSTSQSQGRFSPPPGRPSHLHLLRPAVLPWGKPSPAPSSLPGFLASSSSLSVPPSFDKPETSLQNPQLPSPSQPCLPSMAPSCLQHKCKLPLQARHPAAAHFSPHPVLNSTLHPTALL